MPYRYTNVFNLPATTLSADMTVGATTASVVSEANLPAAAPYVIRIENEILLVTGGVGTLNLTVSRAQETGYLAGAAAAHLTGAAVYHPLTAGALDLIRADQIQLGLAAGLPATTGQKKGNSYFSTDTGAIKIFDGTSWTSIPSGAGGLVIGYAIADGTVGNNVGPMLAAPRAGTVSKCIAVVKASDPSTGLTFRIMQNGTTVFTSSPTIAAGASSGSLYTFTTLTTVPLNVAAGDVFSIDITGGNANWKFSAQLET